MPNRLSPLRVPTEDFLDVYGHFEVSFSSSSKGLFHYLSTLHPTVLSDSRFVVVEVIIPGVADLGRFTVSELLDIHKAEACICNAYAMDFVNLPVLIATTDPKAKLLRYH